MNCAACGRQIPDDSAFCKYCGHSLTGEERPAHHETQVKSSMSTGMIIVIVIVVLVVISSVSAAVLYFMVQGFGSAGTTPTAMYSRLAIPGGVQVNIVAITRSDVTWSHVSIQLTDGVEFAQWSPVTENLDGNVAVTRDYGTDALGSLTISCNVSDISGDGYLNGADYISVIATDGTSFSSTVTYTLRLIYEPTGEYMGYGITFTG